MTQRWAIILMDGSPKPEIHAGWLIEGSEQMAEDFRQFVHAEVDPAVKVRLMDPVGELLTWRESERALPQPEQPPFDEEHHHLHTPNRPVSTCANCSWNGWLQKKLGVEPVSDFAARAHEIWSSTFSVAVVPTAPLEALAGAWEALAGRAEGDGVLRTPDVLRGCARELREAITHGGQG